MKDSHKQAGVRVYSKVMTKGEAMAIAQTLNGHILERAFDASLDLCYVDVATATDVMAVEGLLHNVAKVDGVTLLPGRRL